MPKTFLVFTSDELGDPVLDVGEMLSGDGGCFSGVEGGSRGIEFADCGCCSPPVLDAGETTAGS